MSAPIGEGSSGPGPFAPDGSPVHVYRLLEPMGEPELIHSAFPEGCEILELGCGAGRTTHRLIELGHPVVAVDNSPEMLAHVRGAQTVLSDIEALQLGRTFEGVVLASYLVNTPRREQRAAFLSTCARHVSKDGSVLIQRAGPDHPWIEESFHESRIGDVSIRTEILERRGNIIHVTAEYTVGGGTWKHEYWSELLDVSAISSAIDEAGLSPYRWLDPGREWIEAAAVDQPAQLARSASLPAPQEWATEALGEAKPGWVGMVRRSRQSH